MLFLFLYKSLPYRIVKSPINPDWAFLMIIHVPRLFLDQCFTILIRPDKQYP